MFRRMVFYVDGFPNLNVCSWHTKPFYIFLILKKRMHMSKARIYDQLTSENGEKFTAEEAQYAIDNLDD